MEQLIITVGLLIAFGMGYAFKVMIDRIYWSHIGRVLKILQEAYELQDFEI